MADEISSKLGFDVAQAVAALKTLNRQLGTYEKRVNAAATASKSFNFAGSTSDKVLAKTADTSKKTTSALKGLAGSAVQVAKGFALFRGIGLTVGIFADAAKGAIELQKRIGAIQSISTEFRKQTVGDISNTITGLANEFGQPVQDVAIALYDALSLQIGTAAESTRFLTDALQLSRGALISTTDSGNLLAGAIKAYGLSAANAADISNKFFKTIDVGRVTGADLADTFGRITPLAAAMGISIEETLAGVATLTIQGVRADDALTQLTNVMVRLAKPAGDLRGRLDELGFANAEAAIAATGGLVPALQKITENTDGSTTAISKLFPNIRALRGVIGLLKDDAKGFADNLKEIAENADGAAKAAANLVINTSGGTIEKNFNRIKNNIINGTGVILDQVVHLADVLDRIGTPISGPRRKAAGGPTLDEFRSQLNQEAALETEGLTEQINRRKKIVEDFVSENLTQLARERQGTLSQLTSVTTQFATHFRLRGLTVQNFVDNARTHLERLQQEITSLGEGRRDFAQGARAGQFERSLRGLNPEEESVRRAIQVNKLLDRVQSLSKQGDVRGSREAADAALQQAERFAELTGNESLVNKVIKAQSASTDTLITQDQQLLTSAQQLLQVYQQQATAQSEQVEIKRELLRLLDLEREAPGARADATFAGAQLGTAFAVLKKTAPELQAVITSIQDTMRAGLTGNDPAQVQQANQQLLQLAQQLSKTNPQATQAIQQVLNSGQQLVSANEAVLAVTNRQIVLEQAMNELWDSRIQKAKTLQAIQATEAAAQPRALGGLIHRADGGFAPRGTDTVPAMLSPGEFVVNAKSARKFYSQLVAINRGSAPQYRADGGSVTNVGDISISVNGAASPRDTARAVQKQLRREFRRGTSKR